MNLKLICKALLSLYFFIGCAHSTCQSNICIAENAVKELRATSTQDIDHEVLLTIFESLPDISRTTRNLIAKGNIIGYLDGARMVEKHPSIMASLRKDADQLDQAETNLIVTVLENEYSLGETLELAGSADRLVDELARTSCVDKLRLWCVRAHLMLAVQAQANGDALLADEQYRLAEQELDATVPVDAIHLEQITAGRGIVAFQAGRPDEAADLLVRTSELASKRAPLISDAVLYSNTAIVLISAGRLDEAENWAKVGIALCGDDSPHCNLERGEQTLARVRTAQGRHFESLNIAIAAFEKRAATIAKGSRQEIAQRAAITAALNELGEYERASEWSRIDLESLGRVEAVRQAELVGLAIQHSTAVTSSGSGAPQASIAFLEKILEFDVELAPDTLARLHTSLASLRVKYFPETPREIDLAKQHVQRAENLIENGSYPTIEIAIAMVDSQIKIVEGETAEGFRHLDDTLALAMPTARRESYATTAAGLSEKYGTDVRTLHYLEIARANESHENLLTLSNRAAPRQRQNKRKRALYALQAFSGDRTYPRVVQSAFLESQRVFTSSGGEALRLALETASSDDNTFGPKISRLEVLTSQRARLLASESTSSKASKFATRMADVNREIVDIQNEIFSARPALRELKYSTPVAAEEVARALKPGEIFLQILSAEDKTHIFSIEHTGAITWNITDVSYENICSLVARVRSAIDLSDRIVCPEQPEILRSSEFDAEAAHEIYELIIAPLTDQLSDVHTLITSIDGPLASVPLAALLELPLDFHVSSSEQFRDASWLVHKYAFILTPDAESFVRLSENSGAQNKAENANQSLLAIGAPCIGYLNRLGCPELIQDPRVVLRGGDRGPFTVDQLPALPGAALELAVLARLPSVTKAQLLTGQNATEANIRNVDWSNFDKAIFATHALNEGELGAEEPSLVLTHLSDTSNTRADDGYLSASEIASLGNMDLDLVVIAGCNTASPAKNFQSSPLSGLARAFFASGNTRLMMSHAPLRDDLSILFSKPLIEASSDYHHVIRRAMIEVMTTVDPDPSVWAGPIFVGR